MTNLVGIFSNLSRAYEIALLGNYKIQVVFENTYKNGFKDYKEIKKFYKGVEFVKNGDIIIDIIKPNAKDIDILYESLEDIHKRVKKAKNNIIPSIFKSQVTCNSFIENALNKLDLPFVERENFITLGKIIAQLEGSEYINIEHIAEAIQYRIPHLEKNYCNAEEESINFGSGINIKLHGLNNDDIKNSIKYLESLIK